VITFLPTSPPPDAVTFSWWGNWVPQWSGKLCWLEVILLVGPPKSDSLKV